MLMNLNETCLYATGRLIDEIQCFELIKKICVPVLLIAANFGVAGEAA
jgi:hypothetical protein